MTQRNLDPETQKHLRELKWNELISRQDAYRFYIKLILGVNAFFYATTGAVLLFYFDQDNTYRKLVLLLPADNYSREVFLLLPILMGTVLGGFLLFATALQRHNSKIIDRIRLELDTKYEMAIELIPDLKLLDRLLLVFGILFFIVAGSISAVQWSRSGRSLFFFVGLIIISLGLLISLGTSLWYRKRTKQERTRSRLKQLMPDLLLLVDEMKKLDEKCSPK